MVSAHPRRTVALDEQRTTAQGAETIDERTGAAAPTCTNCGQREAPKAYTLRFRREDERDRELDLLLCPICLDEICSESTVECL